MGEFNLVTFLVAQLGSLPSKPLNFSAVDTTTSMADFNFTNEFVYTNISHFVNTESISDVPVPKFWVVGGGFRFNVPWNASQDSSMRFALIK